jgi:L,D-transpeptidase catalytic domain/Putative peptidoglycan binding domain
VPVPIARLLVLSLALVLLTPTGVASASFELGSRGVEVERLGLRLAKLRYLPTDAVGLRFTRATRWAVMAFQKYERLRVDGIVGPKTQAALRGAGRPRAAFGRGRRIAVSLGRQLAFLVDGQGRVLRALSVSTGRPGRRTPQGIFRIFWRERRSWSVDYSMWLPWAAYFHKGYALHGSRSVPARPRSHGCVRVPWPFARAAYAFGRLGTRVFVR